MQRTREFIKLSLQYKPLFIGLLSLWALCAIYTIVALIGMTVSDHQIVSHYSIFGESHFYRARWWYLISFIVAGLVISLVHTMLSEKLQRQKSDLLATVVVYSGIVVLAVTGIMMLSVYSIAVLS